ncbi:alpha/beta-hydrolase [Neurospora crassa]|uniref:Alpha/beta hydrolase fold protein n=1 Tax=Neurospora crassa (strain ATCC 24698 / 74-OR23-1A / CBS 708.71 / DSM 1257 / FGSC 987) TaxID=367110 RepID=Q7S082_NEUCR|nr:alpha/beta hydrolase fold protein [Neurospora crassa OR74A]EAA28713.1 alpha/beta hydrolase fold protein [Neurospora crassa OR74A]KHE78313.1 alpha/beta-hydrolase [Neurospora crassa]|eukprot:XP_957949.1 alpha/beta hydrolase fold protein [Neurospora crassa OR74A]
MAAIPPAAALDTAGPTGSEEIHVAPSLPLTQKLKYGALAYGITKLIKTPLNLITAIKTDYLGSSPTNPDIIKAYPSRPQLPVRVFLPKSHSGEDGPCPTKLPTLLTIHGGGFVLGSPYDNDSWNRRFVQLAQEGDTPFCVIALDYRKAPSYPFPTAIHDLEAVILDLFKSDDLPGIDLNRVAIAGWSAGGNLALAVSQLPNIRPLLKAVVPMYPVLDFVTPSETKATKSRRYKPALGGFRGKDTDFLMGLSGMFDWAYVSPGQKMGDPLLSPVYAVSVEEATAEGAEKVVVVKGREKFPANVFVIACELDMLGGEAWRMACKLGGKKVPGVEDMLGREEVGEEKGKLELEDERFHWRVEVDEGQVKRRYRWLLVPDAIHGYDQDGVGRFGDEELVRDGMEKREEVMKIIRGWLMDGVL